MSHLKKILPRLDLENYLFLNPAIEFASKIFPCFIKCFICFMVFELKLKSEHGHVNGYSQSEAELPAEGYK